MAPTRGQYQLLADAQAKRQELKSLYNKAPGQSPLTTPTRRPQSITTSTQSISSSIGKSFTMSLPKLDFHHMGNQAHQQQQQQGQHINSPGSPLTRSWASRFEEAQQTQPPILPQHQLFQQTESINGTGNSNPSPMFETHDPKAVQAAAGLKLNTTSDAAASSSIDGTMTRDSDLDWTFAQQGLTQPRHSSSSSLKQHEGEVSDVGGQSRVAVAAAAPERKETFVEDGVAATVTAFPSAPALAPVVTVTKAADNTTTFAAAPSSPQQQRQQQKQKQPETTVLQQDSKRQLTNTQLLIASGLRLIDVSIKESQTSGAASYDKLFEREMYVEGVAKMLQALPPQLDENEVAKIESFLPPAVVAHLRRPEPPKPAFVERPSDATIFYRIVYNYVLILFQLANIIIPFVTSWVNRIVPVDGINVDLKTGHRHGGGGGQNAVEGRARSASRTRGGLLGRPGRQALVYFLGGLGHGLLDGCGDGLAIIDQRAQQRRGQAVVR